MYLGDYVWFDPKDDVFCGLSYPGPTGTFRAGKIMKYTRNTNPSIFWITPLPITDRSSAMPLWAIPEKFVREMEAKDAMLAMLENA